MTVSRIAPVAEPLAGALAGQMARLLPPGMPAPQLFLSVARNAGLFGHLVDTGLVGPTGLLDRRVLPKALRETVILRTCVATGNDYEFNLHVQTISERMGLTTAQIDGIRRETLDAQHWSPRQIAACALVDALVASRTVPDALYTSVRAQLDEATLIEITLLTGLYTGVAMLVGLIRPALDRYRPGPPFMARQTARAAGA